MNRELTEVWDECAQPGWDGYNAFPVTAETMEQVRAFVDSLPDRVPRPSIGAEPDGNITLEWATSAVKRLSVSISAQGVLHFAAMIDDKRVSGSEQIAETNPETVLRLIDQISG